MSIGDGPEDSLESVETGGQQGGTTHKNDEHAGGVRPGYKSVENLVCSLVYQPQAEHMKDHGQNDQGKTPCPVSAPDSVVSLERCERN